MARRKSKSNSKVQLEESTVLSNEFQCAANFSPSLATFVVVFSVYLRTVSPSIAGGDSGELLAEGCQLGTPHPPGYPLYMIITYAVSSIGNFFGSQSVALYMNITSCLFGALTCALVTSSVLIVTTKGISYYNRQEKPSFEDSPYCLCACSAMTMGFLCAFSPLMWQYSVTSEVFALNNFFVGLIMNLTLKIACYGDKGWIELGAFVCGLALTNQMTIILLEIPLIVWVFITCSVSKDIRVLQRTALFFLIGVVPMYFILVFCAIFYPHAGSWGEITTFEGFLAHLRRKDYGTFTLFSGNDANAEGLVERILFWAFDFSYQGGFIVFILCMIGCAVILVNRDDRHLPCSLKREDIHRLRVKSASRALAFSLIIYLVSFHSLSNLPLKNPLLFGVHQRFWMQPNILSFVMAGVGLTWTIQRFVPVCQKYQALVYGSMVVLTLWSLKRGFSISDQSTNEFFKNYAMGILDVLPPNSLLLINYDQQWTSIRYLQECEHFRDDVTSINLSMMTYPWWESKHKLYPHVKFPGSHYTQANSVQWNNGGFTFLEFIDSNYHSFDGRIFIGGDINFDKSHQEYYEEIPHGMSRHLMRKSEAKKMSADSFLRSSRRTWLALMKFHTRLPDSKMYPAETWEWTVTREFYSHLVARATYLLELVVSEERSNNVSGQLLALFESAVWMEYVKLNDVEHSLTPGLVKNLGLAYMHIVRSKTSTNFAEIENALKNPEMGGVDLLEGMSDLLPSHEEIDWKTWASRRWNLSWGEFLRMNGAEMDSSYASVKNIYNGVMQATGGEQIS
mmetsp:Transcript_22145/g.33237  ORF Transcript_22145/g.33237 Transcript_22145/m.33237 type:complete len:792 (+) Transcript_22145:73-2448(+)